MSWRVVRRILLLAVVAAAVMWWISLGKPSFTQMVDKVTGPILGSKAAVQESELNRVSNQAIAVVAEQAEAQVGMLREGMTYREVKELLGEPNAKEDLPQTKNKQDVARWTYVAAKRVLTFEEGRIVSIAIR